MTLWAVAATFFDERSPQAMRWLDDFVINSQRHRFVKVGQASSEKAWHGRRNRATSAFSWLYQIRQAKRALRADGIVTVFPPLAILVGMLQRLNRTKKPHVAWCFNLGSHPGGLRRRLARFAAKEVSLFVVHSRAEIATVSAYLNIPLDRVVFAPLQTAISLDRWEEGTGRYIVSMGSANRDYETLFKAIEITRLPAKVLAAERLLEGLSIPDSVEVMPSMDMEASRDLARNATISVIPIRTPTIASGQVTLVDAFAMGQCVVATRSIGTVDYIDHGVDGILVSPNDPRELAAQLMTLWNDPALRKRLGQAALARGLNEFSDLAAARELNVILDMLTDS